MESKRALLIALVAAALITVALLLGLFRPASAPTQPQECPEPSVVYVYASEEQKEAANDVVADLKMMLQYWGVNIVNVPMCTVSAQNFPWKLQIYPAMLVRGNVTLPREYVSRTLDGYRELYPLISAMIARQRGVNVIYSYAGEAVIVPGTAPLTNIPVSTQLLRDVLSLVFLINVTQVSSYRDEGIASQLALLPGVVVKSSYNLSLGAPYVVELAPGFYALAERFQRTLLQNLGVFAYEISRNPLSGLEGGVSLGASGDATLYLLEDYHCPFCAKFINSTGELLLELAREGRLRVVFVDLVVHSEVAPVHAFAQCLFNLTGNASLYFDLTRELYKALLSRNQVTLDDAVKFARTRVPQDVLNSSIACGKRFESEVLAKSISLRSLGFTGTPTFIFWNDLAGRGLLLEGCLDTRLCISREDFHRILEWLRKV